MSQRVRLGLAAVGAICVATLLLLAYARHAVQQVQPFYEAALLVDANVLEEASKNMETRVAAIANDVVQEADASEPMSWQAKFTDAEVNAWLAVTLADKYPDLLPESITDPRIAFAEDEILVGFRYRQDKFETVISVRASAELIEPEQLAVRLVEAHAGTLPLPLTKVVEALEHVAKKQQVALQWSEQAGQPIARFSLTDMFPATEVERVLDSIAIHEHTLVLSGHTRLPSVEFAQKPETTKQR